MAENVSPATPPTESAPANESPAQRDARLRRMRRNAKIAASGSDRLNKITSMSGRPAAAEAELKRPSPSQSRSTSYSNGPSTASQSTSAASSSLRQNHQQPTTHDDTDPAEVDISNMFQRPPQASSNDPQQDLLRQMLRAGPPDPNQPNDGSRQNMDDPIMQMMQQMMGVADGASGGSGGGGGGLPPALASLLGGEGADAAQAPGGGSADYIWRIVHALSSLLLAVYAVITLSFTTTSFTRRPAPPASGYRPATSNFDDDDHDGQSTGARLFYLFATAEVVLQSTRYFVDRGQLPRSSGWTAKVVGFLPEPYAGYLRVLMRYGVIYTTVVSDAFVVVFVLGCVAWWKGLAGT